MDRDLVEDIRANEHIISKVRDGKRYAQNLYAAMCNMRWQQMDVMPILKDEFWSVSWRSAGGIVASLRSSDEDYIDWYCSGIGGGLRDGGAMPTGYTAEGTVTEEIEMDMNSIGWRSSPWPKDD